MQKFALVLSAMILGLNMGAAMAQGDPTPSKSPPARPPGPPASQAGDMNRNFVGKSQGKAEVGFLSPQQQMMLAHESGGQAELNRLSSMSQNDRLKLQARLQKQWDDLPPPQKEKLQRQLADKMTQGAYGVPVGKSEAETAGASSPGGSSAMRKDAARGGVKPPSREQ